MGLGRAVRRAASHPHPGSFLMGGAAASATATPPAAALNLAMQVGDCLLSAGMSANDVVVAMLGITDAYGLTRVHVDVTYTSISASCYPARGAADHLHQSGAAG